MKFAALCARVALTSALVMSVPSVLGRAAAQESPQGAPTAAKAPDATVAPSAKDAKDGWVVISTPTGHRLMRVSPSWFAKRTTSAPPVVMSPSGGGTAAAPTATPTTEEVTQMFGSRTPAPAGGEPAPVGPTEGVDGAVVPLVGGEAPQGETSRPTLLGSAWAPEQMDGSVVPPTAPAGLIVQPAAGGGIQVSWQDLSTNESSFEVMRQRQAGSNWNRSTTLRANANTSVLVDNPGNGNYRYRVRAVNGSGTSAFTPWGTMQVVGQAPAAPSQAAASDLGNGSEIRITWADNSADETGFELQRETQSGSVWGSPLTLTAAANQTSYTDAAAIGTFRYRLRAINSAGASPYTAWATVTVGEVTPAAPSNLQASDQGNGWHIRTTWVDNSTNESGFHLERQTFANGVWSHVTTIWMQANVTAFQEGLGAGTYRFRVKAVNSFGSSAYTPWTQATIASSTPTAPEAPTGVMASDVGNRRALVSWTDASTNETGFEIERSPAFGSGTVVVGANVVGYIDQSGPGEFSYRVRARGQAGNSAYSSWAMVTVAEIAPSAPTNLQASAEGNDGVNLSWTDTSNNESGFRIERQTQGAGGAWGTVTTLTAPVDATGLSDTPGSGTHRYRIAATNFAGDSAFTAWTSVGLDGGWTVFTPSADTRIIYVSSSQGNDANDGLSPDRPVRTIARGYGLMRNRMPDWLLLKRGDEWTDVGLGPAGSGSTPGNWTISGRSASEMALVSSYGPGTARPRIKATGDVGMIMLSGDSTRDHLAIVGIEFYQYRRDPSNPAYSLNGAGPAIRRYKDGTNFLIEDCLFRFYGTALVVETGGTAGISNVRFRRNIVTDQYGVGHHSQGIYLTHCHGVVVEENVFDRNGWYPGAANATVYNHNMYILEDVNTGVVIRNNISARAAATGIQCRPGGTVTGNLVLQCPIGISIGHAQVNWPTLRPTGEISRNVILGAASIADQPRGRGINLERTDGVQVFDNIIARVDNTVNSSTNVVGIRTDLEHWNMMIRDNIIYRWDYNNQGFGVQFNGSQGQNNTVRNNIVQQSDGGVLVGQPTNSFANYSYQGNRYFSGSGATSWFELQGSGTSFNGWVSASGESGAMNGPGSFPDPNRDIATYMQSIGMSGGVEAFLNEARQQSRANWRPAFTAQAVTTYIRAGFGR